MSAGKTESGTWAVRLAAVALLWLWAVGAAAETPDEFAKRLSKMQGVSAVANLREDRTLGSITISVLPELLADRAKVEPLLGEIGRFAVAGQYRATVVTPTQRDNDLIRGMLNAAGVHHVTPKVMADIGSIKTTRIFLIPRQ
jgi:hypothetical protein